MQLKYLNCLIFIFALLLNSPVFSQDEVHSFRAKYISGDAFHLNAASLRIAMQPAAPVIADSSQQQSILQKTKSPKAALWRAIFVPGWGQIYNEKYKKAAFVIALESFFIVRAVNFNQKKQQEHGEDAKEKRVRQRNDEVWRLLVTRLLSVLDAYVDAHLFGFDESPDVGLILQTESTEGISLSCNLNW